MIDETACTELANMSANVPADTNSLDKKILDEESKELLTKIVAETDIEKTKDLTYLFNINQNKKTMVRQNKLNELQDILVDQAMERFSAKPDEISNKELLDGMKTVQDMLERSQKQVNGVAESPLIQINQQTNEVNVGDISETTTRESRERVKAAVMSILNGISAARAAESPEIIDVVTEEKQDDN